MSWKPELLALAERLGVTLPGEPAPRKKRARPGPRPGQPQAGRPRRPCSHGEEMRRYRKDRKATYCRGCETDRSRERYHRLHPEAQYGTGNWIRRKAEP